MKFGPNRVIVTPKIYDENFNVDVKKCMGSLGYEFSRVCVTQNSVNFKEREYQIWKDKDGKEFSLVEIHYRNGKNEVAFVIRRVYR